MDKDIIGHTSLTVYPKESITMEEPIVHALIIEKLTAENRKLREALDESERIGILGAKRIDRLCRLLQKMEKAEQALKE